MIRYLIKNNFKLMFRNTSACIIKVYDRLNSELSEYVLNQMVRCSILDNGAGCSEVIDGMGISGMRKRVREVNGILDFETEVKSGWIFHNFYSYRFSAHTVLCNFRKKMYLLRHNIRIYVHRMRYADFVRERT